MPDRVRDFCAFREAGLPGAPRIRPTSTRGLGPGTKLADKDSPFHGFSLVRISHRLTVEARNRPAITALRLLVALNAGFQYARIVHELGAERGAPLTDGLLTHFASPRGEKSRLVLTDKSSRI